MFFTFVLFEPDQMFLERCDAEDCQNGQILKIKMTTLTHISFTLRPQNINLHHKFGFYTQNVQQHTEECACTCEYVCVGCCMGPQVSWTVCEGFQRVRQKHTKTK